VLSYPSGMNVSSRALTMLADTLRRHRNERATRWRKLSAGRQALLVVARGEAFVILDGSLLRIDRVGMTSGRDRAFIRAVMIRVRRRGARSDPYSGWPLVPCV
jgi:hypothetical protein